MNIVRNSIASKSAAILLLALCLILAWLVIAAPIVSVFTERSAKIEMLEQKLARQEALILSAPALESQLRLYRSAGGDQFFRSTSGSEALASMQRDVLKIVREVGLEVKSTQSRPEANSGERTKISFQLNLSGESKNLARLLQNIEGHTPFIDIDNIVIRAPRSQPSGRIVMLDITMRVSSFFVEGEVNVP